MFEGCLELCRTFIGVQPPSQGCSSADLSEFICEDVLPYQGWAANPTLRDTIVRLLLTAKTDDFTLHCSSPTTADEKSNATNAIKPPPREKSTRRTSATKASSSAAANVAGVENSAARGRAPLTLAAAVDLLDAHQIAWVDTRTTEVPAGGSSSALPTSDGGATSLAPPHPKSEGAGVLLFFVPSRALRERSLGMPIRHEKEEMVSQFIAENAVHGWDVLPNTPDFKARFKNYLVVAGLKALRREHKVMLVYLYRDTTHEVVYRFFPHFALPLTEQEKHEHTLCTSADGMAAASADDEGSPVDVVQRRCCRRYHPLAHFFARRRLQSATFPRVVFDLQVVRQLVVQSPERRLLMQDAVHALFAAHRLHDLRWELLSVVERMHVRRLMDCAGLRIVVASLHLRGRLRELRLVIPMEDLMRGPQTPADGGAQPGSQDAESTAASGRKWERGSEKDADLSDEEGGGGDGDDGEEAGGADSSSSSGGTGSDSDSEVAPSSRRSAAPPALTATRARQMEAGAVLRLDAGQLLEVQAAHEAERRRPLARTAFYPRLRTQASDKARNKLTALALERYMKLRGTLDTQYLLLRNMKAFTLVYTARRTQTGTPLALQHTAAKEEAAAPSGDAVDTALPSALPPPSPPPPQSSSDAAGDNVVSPALSLRFEKNDPRLPKGLTAYSVNTVLEVLLQATPHHAASLRRLAKELDGTVVQRRVLPLLRQLDLVYTTGVSQRGKQRVGMVVLRHPAGGDAAAAVLDDAAKRAVLDAEAAEQEAQQKQQRQQTLGPLRVTTAPSLPSGKAIPTGLVLDAVPALADGVGRSAAGEGLLRANVKAARAVNRIMALRNGYARNALQRVSRLHLELWAQHCADVVRGAKSEDGESRVCDMLDRMTLSTYCIVVGLPQGDLARVLGHKGSDNAAVLSYGVSWSTPLKLLPPSLYGWCMQQGYQMLAMCLTELQDRQLVRHTDSFQLLLRQEERAGVCYALCPAVTVDGYTYTFCSSPVSASSSLYACMRYWLPHWNTVRCTGNDVEARLLDAEPNPTVPQVVALCKVLRREVGVVAAELYQNCGVSRRLRGSRRIGEMQSAVEKSRERRHRRHLRRRQRHRAGEGEGEASEEEEDDVREEGDGGEEGVDLALHDRSNEGSAASARGEGGKGGAPLIAIRRGVRQRRIKGRAPRAIARTEISGATVADALEYAFHHFAPLKRVEEVMRLVLRSRVHHLLLHSLFAAPPMLPAVLQPGAAPAQAQAGGPSWSSRVYRTEFNVCHTGQGGSVYNRSLNAALLHMGELGETLRSLRESHTSQTTSSATAAAAFSAMDVLKAEVESVYAPNAALPPAPPATTIIDTTAVNEATPAQDQQQQQQQEKEKEEGVQKDQCGRTTSSAAADTSSSSYATLSLAAAEEARQSSNKETSTAGEQSSRMVAIFEVVTDILRMIIFSDQAHYRATIARALLAALNTEALVTRARLLLQKMPAFRRSRRQNFRVPLLSLSTSPYVLPPHALRGAARPCANLSLLHHWTSSVDAIGAALCCSGQPRLRMDGGAANTLDALLRPDAAVQEAGHAAAPLLLVRQPAVESSRLSMSPSAVRDLLTKLPLPQLSWPSVATRCEHLRRPPPRESEDVHAGNYASAVHGSGEGGEGGAAAVAGGPAPHRQGRSHARRRTSDPAVVKAEENSDTDSDDDRAVRRVEAEATRQLYPARCVRNAGDPAYLRDFPLDPPPTAAEQRAVEQCRQLLGDGRGALLCEDAAVSPCRLAYPSIFHHVDGSFHAYMWHMVVHTVYRFILHVPGIRHADLETRLMASGVLSTRAVRAVLRFLMDRQLVVAAAEELADDRCVRGGGVLGSAPRLRGPFQRASSASGGLSSAPSDTAEKAAQRSTVEELNRCCYTAVAPLEAVQFAVSAVSW